MINILKTINRIFMINILKTISCIVLFVTALIGALLPILREGEVNWLFDMDIQGGVQIVYRADFSSLSPEQQTDEGKKRLMELSHLRLDARLANFQGVDVRVQILGKDRLIVEIPGIRNIAQVKTELGKPKLISFAHVISYSPDKDNEHIHFWKKHQLWLKTDKQEILGGNILYDEMEIHPDKDNSRYSMSLPLDNEGQRKMSLLTSDAYDKPAQSNKNNIDKGIPLIALFLDQICQDVFVVEDRAIRNGAVTVPTVETAENLKRLLSSGPLPMKFDVYSERSISPLIGSVFRNVGLWGLIISFIALIVYMGFAYFSRPWFVFVYTVTLIFWFLCLIAFANFHLFRISLLQLAGFILLLGLNTDTLVLIFEDLREEFRHERRFKLDIIGEAFKTEWWVIFWGMITTVVVILPLYFQGGVFADYIKLLSLGMVVNILGFIFARLLMSLPIAEEFSKISFKFSLADIFARINFNSYKYRTVGCVVVVICSFAVFIYPGIPLAPIFGGGKAVEITFDNPVSVSQVRKAIERKIGKETEIMTEESENMTRWLLVKFSANREVQEQDILDALASSTGVRPAIISLENISKTLVAKTRFQISAEMFLALFVLAIISFAIYNLTAGLFIVLALIHDIIICLGCMAIFRIPLDLYAIAALSTIIGYSINDSIVILHRLRTLRINKYGEREIGDSEAEELCTENIRNTSARVLITSVTTALPMIILAIMSGGMFRNYSIIVIAGVIFGTLSSLYIVGRVFPHGFVTWGSKR